MSRSSITNTASLADITTAEAVTKGFITQQELSEGRLELDGFATYHWDPKGKDRNVKERLATFFATGHFASFLTSPNCRIIYEKALKARQIRMGLLEVQDAN